jgi:hypothetical protein
MSARLPDDRLRQRPCRLASTLPGAQFGRHFCLCTPEVHRAEPWLTVASDSTSQQTQRPPRRHMRPRARLRPTGAPHVFLPLREARKASPAPTRASPRTATSACLTVRIRTNPTGRNTRYRPVRPKSPIRLAVKSSDENRSSFETFPFCTEALRALLGLPSAKPLSPWPREPCPESPARREGLLLARSRPVAPLAEPTGRFHTEAPRWPSRIQFIPTRLEPVREFMGRPTHQREARADVHERS